MLDKYIYNIPELRQIPCQELIQNNGQQTIIYKRSITMKTATSSKTVKGVVKVETSKKDTPKMKKTKVVKIVKGKNLIKTENVMNHPVSTVLTFSKMKIKTLVKDRTIRVKTPRSMEYKTQIMLLDGAKKEEVQNMFQQHFASKDKDVKWILKRANKYYRQELNHINSGHVVASRIGKVAKKDKK